MSVEGQWNGMPVVVTSKLVPRFLRQTASIDVFVDGECVLRTGGRLKVVGSHTSRFVESATSHEALLTEGIGGVRSFPIRLSMDGELVVESRVYTSNWTLGLWPVADAVAIAAHLTAR